MNLETLFEKTIAVAFREAGVEVTPKAPVRYERFDSLSEGMGSMEMDLYCPSLPDGPLVVDAKYKTKVSSGNLQQMVTYCFSTGAKRAVLVLPEGHLSDKRSYRFAGGGERTGDMIRVDLAELATGAKDVSGWRKNAARMVERVVGQAI